MNRPSISEIVLRCLLIFARSTGNPVLFLFLGLFFFTGGQAFADEQLPSSAASGIDKKHTLEFGFEYNELAQNSFRNLGGSNYTFFIGQQFQQESLKNWGWRFISINVELSNEHLKNKSEVCCIDGNREHLVGTLNHQRLYLDYYPPVLLKKRYVQLEFIPSFGIGHNDWYIKDTAANQDHDVKAYTIGVNGRLKATLFDHYFIEAPNVDIAYIAKKNNSINAQVGEATLDRSRYFNVTLLITLGYKMEF